MIATPRPPRDLAAELERHGDVLAGRGERFAGYAVPGVRFASGEVLALHRFPASSTGEGCSGVWHRARSGRWTLYQRETADGGCARYFSNGIERIVLTPIHMTWTGASRLVVRVGDEIEWELTLAATPATRLLSGLGSILPDALAHSPLAARVSGPLAGLLLGVGPLTLTGESPNGFHFLASATEVRQIAASRAVVQGQSTGDAVAVPGNVRLGGFRIPQRGVFGVVRVTFAPAGKEMAGSSAT